MVRTSLSALHELPCMQGREEDKGKVRRLLCAAVKRPCCSSAHRTLLRLLGEEDEKARGGNPEDLRVDGVLSESLNSFKIFFWEKDASPGWTCAMCTAPTINTFMGK